MMSKATSDVALAGLRATKRFAKAHPDVMSRHLVAVIPLVHNHLFFICPFIYLFTYLL
jgi:hypothetical protein